MDKVYIEASIYTTLAGVEVHFEDLAKEFEPTPRQLLKEVDDFLEEVSSSITSAMMQEVAKNNVADVLVEVDINGFGENPLLYEMENPMREGQRYTVDTLEKEVEIAAEEFTIFELRRDVILFIVSSEEFNTNH